jgi:hypothetical protein
MRWRFIEPMNLKEQRERAEITAKIDSWWQQFQKAANHLNALFTNKKPCAFKSSDDLPKWMATHLQAISPKLMWEFGPAVKKEGHRLVITPESAFHLRPLTNAILKRAPKISNWEFYGHRLPESVSATHQTVETRTGSSSEDFQVRLSRGDHNRVDVSYFSPSLASADDRDALHAAFVATETLLGEEYLDKWVGAFEIKPLKKSSALGSLFSRGDDDGKHLIPLERMKETFDSVIQSIRDQLPEQPHFAWIENAQWTVGQLKPHEEEDYPGQDDLVTVSVGNMEMWMATRQAPRFYSDAFSRCGETFAFVKIDGLQGLVDSEFADRSEIEDGLDATLKPQKLGCTIGGGSGIRYAYIELALADLGPAIQAIRKRLRAAKVPKRSWIQLHDSDFAAEWVGIYDDTPPPPMPDFDD